MNCLLPNVKKILEVSLKFIHFYIDYAIPATLVHQKIEKNSEEFIKTNTDQHLNSSFYLTQKIDIFKQDIPCQWKMDSIYESKMKIINNDYVSTFQPKWNILRKKVLLCFIYFFSVDVKELLEHKTKCYCATLKGAIGLFE